MSVTLELGIEGKRACDLLKISLLISLQTFTARTGNTLGLTRGVENSFACLTPERKQERMKKNESTKLYDHGCTEFQGGAWLKTKTKIQSQFSYFSATPYNPSSTVLLSCLVRMHCPVYLFKVSYLFAILHSSHTVEYLYFIKSYAHATVLCTVSYSQRNILFLCMHVICRNDNKNHLT